jgi:hypothetical protein
VSADGTAARCTCTHAPEQHYIDTGCSVVSTTRGSCHCEWDGRIAPTLSIELTELQAHHILKGLECRLPALYLPADRVCVSELIETLRASWSDE